MTRNSCASCLTLSVLLLLALGVGHASAFAASPGGSMSGGGSFAGGGSFHGGGAQNITGFHPVPKPIVPHGFFGHANIPPVHPHHKFAHRHFTPLVVAGTIYVPPVMYASPYGYDYGYSDTGNYDQPVYDSPVSYGQPAYPGSATVSIAPPAPPEPRPSVVEYATGRYELRGDGMTMPYTWVWIPNPPAGPPEQPTAPPPPGSSDRPARRSQIYRWTDEQGVMHMTDQWDAVPPKYRSQAKQPQPS